MILLCHRSFVEFKLLILRVMKQTEEFIFPFSFCIFPFHFSFFSPLHDIFSPLFLFLFFFCFQFHWTNDPHTQHLISVWSRLDQTQSAFVKVLGTSFEGWVIANSIAVEKGQLTRTSGSVGGNYCHCCRVWIYKQQGSNTSHPSPQKWTV